MSDEYVEKYLRIPIPVQRKEGLIEEVKKQIEKARQARDEELSALRLLRDIPTGLAS